MLKKFYIKSGIIKMNDKMDVCSNWWPLTLGESKERCKTIKNPMCRVCANWLTNEEEIEDIEDIIKEVKDVSRRDKKCINEWYSKENK